MLHSSQSLKTFILINDQLTRNKFSKTYLGLLPPPLFPSIFLTKSHWTLIMLATHTLIIQKQFENYSSKNNGLQYMTLLYIPDSSF
ncbi:hypothetical protein JHK85_010374 [Glycine max]|uniref:Uncharacterized protein n=1 Tax=Glycine soja TaxID=3848 RepID=A0A445L057_GLYSO|nr:hypothetical protein JHK85_010374 [Glycine max]RZC16502.1 hypothetical protein D0Y65_009679 [Glycine soja]